MFSKPQESQHREKDYQEISPSHAHYLKEAQNFLRKITPTAHSLNIPHDIDGIKDHKEFVAAFLQELNKHPRLFPKEIITDAKDFLDDPHALLSLIHKKGIKKLRLESSDKSIDEKNYEALVSAIEVNSDFTFEVVLPNEKSETQRKLDNIISSHITSEKIKEEKKPVPPQVVIAAPRIPRKRPRSDPKRNLNIDIQFQKEQEQQVQIQINKEFSPDEKLDNEEMKQFLPETISTFDGFFNALCNKRFNIPPENYLLSKENAQEIWSQFFGCIKESKDPLAPAPHMRSISMEACEQLLRHPHQFKAGIDLNHLPVGFTLLDRDSRPIVHYNPNLLVKNEPLRLRLPTAPETTHVYYSRLEQSLKNLNEKSPPEKVILDQWKKITASKEYHRNMEKSFLQHIPVMLHFNEKELTDLFSIASTKSGLNEERFNFAINNLPKIATIKDIEDRESNSLIVKNLFADNKDLAETLIKTAKEHKETDYKHHLLLRLLTNNTSEQVKQWQNVLKLNNYHLDALLDVYNHQGEKGLIDLFTVWENTPESLHVSLQKTLFKNTKSYLSCLDPAYARAIKVIEGFQQDANKYAWWNTLLQKHIDAVGYDDLPTLVNAFKAFCEQVEERNLSFYALEKTSFSDTYNMPVVLARMLTIFKNVSSDDLQSQWEQISQISLASNGAIRANADAKLKASTCNFISKEMKASDEFYDEKMGYNSSIHQFRASENADERKMFFFRRIGHTANRFSFNFYEQAYNAIIASKLPDTTYEYLTQTLLRVTTNQPHVNFLNSEEKQSLEQWKKFLSIIENVELPVNLHMFPGIKPQAQLELLRSLCELESLPALPMLIRMINFITTTLAQRGLGARQELSDHYRLLGICTNDFGESFYNGMRFYEEKDYTSNPSVFKTHLNTVRSLMQQNIVNEKNIGILLAPLISTFQITEDNLDAILNAIKQTIDAAPPRSYDARDVVKDTPYEQVTKALTLLSFMETNKDEKSKQLTSDNLISFIKLFAPPTDNRDNKEDKAAQNQNFKKDEKANKNDNISVRELLEKEFGSYFAKDYFKKLYCPDILESDKNLIEQFSKNTSEKKQYTNILNKFYQVGDNVDHQKIIHNINKISKPLSMDARKNLFAYLNREELYQPPDIKLFNALLTTIIRYNRTDDFILLLSQPEAKTTPALMKKSTLWLEKFLPHIDERQPKGLDKQEVSHLFLPLLLKSTPASLDAVHTVKDSDPLAPAKTAGKNLLNQFFNLFKKNEDQEKKSVEYPAVIEKQKNYTDLFKDTLRTLDFILLNRSSLKKPVFDFLNCYIKNNSLNNNNLNLEVFEIVRMFRETFSLNPEILHSLCYHYSNEHNNLKPNDLITLLKDENFYTLNHSNKILVLNTFSSLLNSGKNFTVQDAQTLLSTFKKESKQLPNDQKEPESDNFIKLVEEIYKSPPYPPLKQFNKWYQDSQEKINEYYKEYNKKPCARELQNGFRFEEAKSQAAQVKGISFEEKKLAHLEKEVTVVKEKNTSELISDFKRIKENPNNISHTQLIALMAELLYRSKGIEGNSFEINHTQYLAILAMLQSGGRITSEIGTGEGKTRIMMIAIACQFALGKTIDFVTSNMELATRDFLEYQSYFKLIGAPTHLVYASSQTTEYRQGGIHFSDAANLSLFRNKARSENQEAKVIDSNRSRRALFLDEADQIYFDASRTRYNYSAAADPLIADMEWVYPLLMDFFYQDNLNNNKKIENLYYDDADACQEEFFKFAAASNLSEEQRMRLQALPSEQIDAWQEAAITARSLRYGIDFMIEPDTTIMTPKGLKMASEAKLVIDKRASHNPKQNPKFSFGVHQCLHALLNKLRHEQNISPSPLQEKLAACNTPFHIDMEKQIIYSSNSKNLLDDYADGHLLAVTGTLGSVKEQDEITRLYKNKNQESMQLVTIPRHKGLQRDDRPAYLTANREQQIAQLKLQIQEAKRNNQPVLVICQNDHESAIIYDELKTALQKEEVSLQYLHSQSSSTEEKTVIKKAGEKNVVTISTGMIGRGTDIKLQDPNSIHGLKILLTYSPENQRDEKQAIGRSGRMGAAGDSRKFLRKPDLKDQFNKPTLTDGYYTAPETYLKQQQALLDRKKQCERLIKFAVGDFNHAITNYYFNVFTENLSRRDRQACLSPWTQFNKDRDNAWNAIWPKIVCETEKTTPSIETINGFLFQYQKQTEKLWTSFCRNINKKETNLNIEVFKDKDYKLKLNEQYKNLIAGFNINQIEPHRVKIYDRYDSALDGVAAVYTSPFETLNAILRGERNLFANFRAWWQGRGILFANFRAWWRGDITFKQFIWAGKKAEEISSPPVSTPSPSKKPVGTLTGLYTTMQPLSPPVITAPDKKKDLDHKHSLQVASKRPEAHKEKKGDTPRRPSL